MNVWFIQAQLGVSAFLTIALQLNEDYPMDPATLSNDYKISKFQAEKIALEMYGRGLPVVIVNPSTPIGPRDIKPTPTGKIVLDFLNGKIPAYFRYRIELD